jgi:hypothetical protein
MEKLRINRRSCASFEFGPNKLGFDKNSVLSTTLFSPYSFTQYTLFFRNSLKLGFFVPF